MSYGDSTGELASYRFEYDSLGRLIRSAELDADGSTVQRTEHIYDGYNRLSRQSWTLGGKTYSESYVYDDPSDTNKNGDGALTQMTTATGAVIDYQYDTLRRLTRSKVALNGSTVYTTAYAFRDLDASRTTTQVQYRNVRNANGEVLEGKKYTYDALGNITRISQSTKPFYTLVAYEYDAQNQLTKETYYNGKGTATKNIKLAYYYDYDTAGNILRVEKGTVNSSGVLTKTVEQTYSYNDSDWNDLLTSVNVNGTTYNFTYDQSGNPERYFTKNGLEYVLDWKNGSQLAYSSCFDEQWQAAYYYDANGIRRQKRLEGDVTNYTTQNGKVIREETSSRYSATCILDFVYDESGRPFALYYSSNGGNSFATYYYILNLQGDVVKLVTESGAVAASYEYDAWGNILSSTGSMARTNPLRYRGYYYDVETGFYYLQSRYYDPANRRFINADVYASTGQGFVGTNMFAYCGNNPVKRSDPTGEVYVEDHFATPLGDGTGFNVDYSDDFLDPYYCLYYAYELTRGNTYYDMDAERIAMEIYAHAYLFKVGGELQQIDISKAEPSSIKNVKNFIKRVGNYFQKHAEVISVNNNEKEYRVAYYRYLWMNHTSAAGRMIVRAYYLEAHKTRGANRIVEK